LNVSIRAANRLVHPCPCVCRSTTRQTGSMWDAPAIQSCRHRHLRYCCFPARRCARTPARCLNGVVLHALALPVLHKVAAICACLVLPVPGLNNTISGCPAEVRARGDARVSGRRSGSGQFPVLSVAGSGFCFVKVSGAEPAKGCGVHPWNMCVVTSWFIWLWTSGLRGLTIAILSVKPAWSFDEVLFVAEPREPVATASRHSSRLAMSSRRLRCDCPLTVAAPARGWTDVVLRMPVFVKPDTCRLCGVRRVPNPGSTSRQ